MRAAPEVADSPPDSPPDQAAGSWPPLDGAVSPDCIRSGVVIFANRAGTVLTGPVWRGAPLQLRYPAGGHSHVRRADRVPLPTEIKEAYEADLSEPVPGGQEIASSLLIAAIALLVSARSR